MLDSRWLSAVANDDTDAMMRQRTEGIKEVACPNFSRASVKGKYNRSERTEAFHEKKQSLRRDVGTSRLAMYGAATAC